MSKDLTVYGVPQVKRPKLKATKQLDLSGMQGRQIVRSEAKLALRMHRKTFTKLADM